MEGSRAWIKGKNGKGYKILGSGTKDAYLAVTIPRELGFERADRVYLKPLVHRGVYGLFITKERPTSKP